MRERSGRQDVPQRSGPNGLARLASAANATNESGGEAEIAGGVGVRRGAATQSLRSARGAAHSGAARHAVGGIGLCRESDGTRVQGLKVGSAWPESSSF
jgi:hypothetical protein